MYSCSSISSVAFYQIAVYSSFWAGQFVLVVSIFLFFVFLVLFCFLLILLLFILLLLILLCGVPFNIRSIRNVFSISAHVARDLQSNAKRGGSTADTATLTSIVTRIKL